MRRAGGRAALFAHKVGCCSSPCDGTRGWLGLGCVLGVEIVRGVWGGGTAYELRESWGGAGPSSHRESVSIVAMEQDTGSPRTFVGFPHSPLVSRVVSYLCRGAGEMR